MYYRYNYMEQNTIGYFEYEPVKMIDTSGIPDPKVYPYVFDRRLTTDGLIEYLLDEIGALQMSLDDFSGAYLKMIKENIYSLYPDTQPDFAAYKLYNTDGYDMSYGSNCVFVIFDKVTGYYDSNSNTLSCLLTLKRGISKADLEQRTPAYYHLLFLSRDTEN